MSISISEVASELKLSYLREFHKELIDESKQLHLNNEEFLKLFLERELPVSYTHLAGTGKTMIAIEKAKRHSIEKERVLFLCYNTYLKEFLQKNYCNEYIDYYTISGFACKLCDTRTPNYDLAKEKIEDMYLMGSFPYVHVIVDEGQDFGKEDIEESDILQIIHDTIMDKNDDSSFYVFYDKLQLIQAKHVRCV